MENGLLPFDVEVEEQSEALTARAGLTLVPETMEALEVERAVSEEVKTKQRNSGYSEAERVTAIVLLLAAGGDCLDDIGVLAADEGLCRLLGRDRLPSPDTLRRFLNAFHDDALIEAAKARRPPRQEAFIPDESPALAGLAAVNTRLIRRVDTLRPAARATLDHDATLQESHKRDALPHYKGGARVPACEHLLAGAGPRRRRRVPRRQRPRRDGEPPSGQARLCRAARLGHRALLSCGQRLLRHRVAQVAR